MKNLTACKVKAWIQTYSNLLVNAWLKNGNLHVYPLYSDGFSHTYKCNKDGILWEPSGSVVECLTWDWGAAGLSLTDITALCPWARHINPSLVLVQPRTSHPYKTERLLMGQKESNQTKGWVCPLYILRGHRLNLQIMMHFCPWKLFWHPQKYEPRGNAAFCGISSGSSLFAKVTV